MINEGRFKLKEDGTPRKFCFCRTPELIENYDKAIADNTQTWYCHHRLETNTSDGELRPWRCDITVKELIALGMYYDRPPEELIFLTRHDHRVLHCKVNSNRKIHYGNTFGKGKKRTDEQKKRISEKLKKIVHTDTWNDKVSKGQKAYWDSISDEERARRCKINSEAQKGKHLSEEIKRKISETQKGRPGTTKGMHWKLVDGKHVYYKED